MNETAAMKVTMLCSDASHPVNHHLERWMAEARHNAFVELVRSTQDAIGGDILFLVSCSEVINREHRAKYRACLVLHASALPQGRGWSPHIWDLIGGASGIWLTLLEAEDSVDTGRIYSQRYIPVPDHALSDEINDLLFDAEIDLIDFAVEHFGQISPTAQSTETGSYCRRRTPSDSEVDPEKSIAEQFDLIRVCDPQRFPAYFHLRGHKYMLRLEKQDGD